MERDRDARKMLGIASLGHGFFAVTLIGLGIIGMVQGDFTPSWGGVPKELPARHVLAGLCAGLSLVLGLGLLGRRVAGLAARGLLIAFLAWLVLVRAPHLVSSPRAIGSWWGCGNTAVMAAAAWVLAVWLAGARGLHTARGLYGLAMLPFGVAHFLYLEPTAALVPAWLPGHVAWAAFTGLAFLAAGAAVLFRVYARLAVTLTAVQMGLFTLLVWVPIVAAGPNAFQWSEFVDSWALTAGAWVVADSYRGVSWRAVRDA